MSNDRHHLTHATAKMLTTARLSRHEEAALLAVLHSESATHQERTAARDRLILANLRLVQSIARRFATFVDLDDVFMAGVPGLIKAVDSYDPDSGCKLGTHATWWIRSAITHWLQQTSRTVRVPTDVHQALLVMARTGERPTDSDTLRHGEAAARGCVSLDTDRTPERRKEFSLTDALVAGDPDACSVAHQRAMEAQLAKALRTLPARERKILALHFGLGGREPLMLREIAKAFGISKERVRQLRVRAMAKLCRAMGKIAKGK